MSKIAISKQEIMDVATISADDCCALGKWLYEEGKFQFGHLKSHADCVTQHAQFHQEAGKVAQAINAKQFNEAQAMIGPDTPFFIASGNVIMALSGGGPLQTMAMPVPCSGDEALLRHRFRGGSRTGWRSGLMFTRSRVPSRTFIPVQDVCGFFLIVGQRAIQIAERGCQLLHIVCV